MVAPMKTPGVYIVEKNAFPNSVVEVATAVPAFIGYTEKADNQGRSLAGKPWPISSLSEFITYFGGAPTPVFTIENASAVAATQTLTLKAVPPDGAKVTVDAVTYTFKTALSAPAVDGEVLIGADGAAALSNLATAINTQKGSKVTAKAAGETLGLVANTAGKSGNAIVASSTLDAAVGGWIAGGTLLGGVDAVDPEFVVTSASTTIATSASQILTLKAAPTADATVTVDTTVYTFKTQASSPAVAGEVLIGDEATSLTHLAAAINAQPASKVTAKASANSLTVVVKTAGKSGNDITVATTLDAAVGGWVAGGTLQGGTDAGPAAPVVTPYYLEQTGGKFNLYYSMQLFFQNLGGPCYVVSVGTYADSGAPDMGALRDGIDALEAQTEPTMVVIPDAVLLEQAECYSLQQHMLQHCGFTMKNRFAILDIWGGDKGRKDPAGDPIDAFRDNLGVNQLDYGAAYYPFVHTTVVESSAINFKNFRDGANASLLAMMRTEMGLPSSPGAGDPTGPKPVSDRIAIANYVAGLRANQLDSSQPVPVWPTPAPPTDLQLNESLLGISQGFKDMIAAATRQLNLMPPSAAMAGLYTMVDNSRGVWKAPANVSVSSVVAPAVNITAADQEDLNVTPMGKSINAIRAFKGEGALVWGARTLNGNSLDWRYINVRRTMIMLEESCKLAAKAMVFEPNVAGTWVTIRSMIENFLTSVWKRGGLAGAVPADAFSVHVGLGDTMTADDILEGILRVTVLVAISHPAEFIEITFQQQMQKS